MINVDQRVGVTANITDVSHKDPVGCRLDWTRKSERSHGSRRRARTT